MKTMKTALMPLLIGVASFSLGSTWCWMTMCPDDCESTVPVNEQECPVIQPQVTSELALLRDNGNFKVTYAADKVTKFQNFYYKAEKFEIVEWARTMPTPQLINGNHRTRKELAKFKSALRLEEGNFYFNMVENTEVMAKSKADQTRLSDLYARTYGCSLNELGIMPTQWRLSDKKECLSFVKFATEKGNAEEWYIRKPSNAGAARGITVHSGFDRDLQKAVDCDSGEDVVVQIYVQNPLLIDGRKFDIRSFVLIANTRPFIVLHRSGFLRRSLSKFSKDPSDTGAHLTNGHIQREDPDFDPGDFVWSLWDLAEHLHRHSKACKSAVKCYNHIERSIAEIERFLFMQVKDQLVRHKGTFQLMGTDFLVTDKLEVLLVEANGTPGLNPSDSEMLREKYQEMVTSMYEIVFDMHENPTNAEDWKPGSVVDGWVVLFNEQYDQCYGTQPYNPCKALAPVGLRDLKRNVP